MTDSVGCYSQSRAHVPPGMARLTEPGKSGSTHVEVPGGKKNPTQA